jgi:hypothetical protein
VPGAALIAVAGAASAGRLVALARGRLPRAGTVVELVRGWTSGRSATKTRLAIAGRWSLRTRLAVGALAALTIAAAVPRIADIADLGPRLDYQARLQEDLDRAIDAAGGRERVLACGRPAVGRYRGTLMAYRLDVPKHVVRADGHPADVTFASRLTTSAPVSPPTGRRAIRTGTWRVSGCTL